MARPKTKIDTSFSLTLEQIEMLDELKISYGNIKSSAVGAAIEKLYKDRKDNYSEKLQDDLRSLTMQVLLENQKLNHRMAQLEKDHTFYQERFESFKGKIDLHTKFMNILKKDWHDWMKILTKVIPNVELVEQKDRSENSWIQFFGDQKNKLTDKLTGK